MFVRSGCARVPGTLAVKADTGLAPAVDRLAVAEVPEIGAEPPDAPAALARPAAALVLGGAETGDADLAAALALVASAGRAATVYLVNDRIASAEGTHGVTLHPAKLPDWLARRALAGLPALAEVWCWQLATLAGATHAIGDWGGSSGLLAVRAALRDHTRIILCGVPMDPGLGHFVRKRSWSHAIGFRKGWIAHRAELAPYVRSLSGWTQITFGAPSAEWLAG